MTIERLKEIVNSGVDEASKMTDLSSGRKKTEWRIILGERVWFKTLLNTLEYKPIVKNDYIDINDIMESRQNIIIELKDKLKLHNCSLRGWVYCSGKCAGCSVIVGNGEEK